MSTVRSALQVHNAIHWKQFSEAWLGKMYNVVKITGLCPHWNGRWVLLASQMWCSAARKDPNDSCSDYSITLLAPTGRTRKKRVHPLCLLAWNETLPRDVDHGKIYSIMGFVASFSLVTRLFIKYVVFGCIFQLDMFTVGSNLPLLMASKQLFIEKWCTCSIQMLFWLT